MPLRHLVFIEIQDEKEKATLVHHHLKELSKKMPGCTQFEFGKCADDSKYHYFFMDFDSEESRDKYLMHPEHEKIAKNVVIPNLKDGLKSATVFDYDKNGQKGVSKLGRSAGISGYILVKDGQESSVLEELVAHCDKINRARPLVNRSVEELGKEYPYAMQIQFSSGINPLKIKHGTPFWTTQEMISKAEGNRAFEENDAIIRSKL